MFIFLSHLMMVKAEAKAQQVKASARMVTFGNYEVKGSEGTLYQITIRADKLSNYLVVDCNCKGGEHGNICYHAAAALKLHLAVRAAFEFVAY